MIGFTLHNITEGIGIAAPIAREQPALVALRAARRRWPGCPAVLGGLDRRLHLLAALGGGVPGARHGAIAQVVVEVTRLILRNSEGTGERREAALDWTTLAGVAAGIAIMYVTALAVAG